MRGDLAWQGFVGVETAAGAMDITSLVSVGFGGGSFPIPESFVLPALHKFAKMGHSLKLDLLAAGEGAENDKEDGEKVGGEEGALR